MLKRIKKALVRNRIKALLDSNMFNTAVLGGTLSTGGKVAHLVERVYMYMFNAIITPIQNADNDKLADLLADLYGPAVKIFEGLSESYDIGEKHAEFIKSLGKAMTDSLDSRDDEMSEKGGEIATDFESIGDILKSEIKKHILTEDEE